MPDSMPNGLPCAREARFALAVLFGINFLNYIDRYVIAAVAPLLKQDFALSDAQLGLATSMFMVAYIVASPFTGIMGDRLPRRWLVGAGVVLWSAATVASGLAVDYRHLLTARSFIGIGEAGFGAVAPTIISDLFPKEKRGRMLAFFYVAIPVGSALGFLLGGWMGASYGWRAAFFVAGAPGLLLGLLAFRMREPARGAGDGVVHQQRQFNVGSLLALLRNRSFICTTAGITAMTFALGGMAGWMPTYFSRIRGMGLKEAGTVFGGMTVVAGLVGTFLGGWLGDRLQRVTDRSYLLVSGVGMLLAVPVTYVGLTASRPAVYLSAWFLAEVLVFLNTGPANAVLINVSFPEVRATAIAASIFIYHLLGDVPSPVLIGKVSDLTGSLPTALLLTTVAVALSGVFYLMGSTTLGADTRRVQQALAEQELPS
jgi:MFS family permease